MLQPMEMEQFPKQSFSTEFPHNPFLDARGLRPNATGRRTRKDDFVDDYKPLSKDLGGIESSQYRDMWQPCDKTQEQPDPNFNPPSWTDHTANPYGLYGQMTARDPDLRYDLNRPPATLQPQRKAALPEVSGRDFSGPVDSAAHVVHGQVVRARFIPTPVSDTFHPTYDVNRASLPTDDSNLIVRSNVARRYIQKPTWFGAPGTGVIESPFQVEQQYQYDPQLKKRTPLMGMNEFDQGFIDEQPGPLSNQNPLFMTRETQRAEFLPYNKEAMLAGNGGVDSAADLSHLRTSKSTRRPTFQSIMAGANNGDAGHQSELFFKSIHRNRKSPLIQQQIDESLLDQERKNNSFYHPYGAQG